MDTKKIIVMHHAPDLDAIGAAWILKKFDSQDYADAKFAFVNPGERISELEATQLGSSLNQATHVDTGMGKFDHHQPDRSNKNTCATKLVYEHICQKYPNTKQDKALKELVKFINEIDHFQEIHWPEAGHIRYVFMIQGLIQGHELTHPNNDESQLYFGLDCIEYGYQNLKQTLLANQLIQEEAIQFSIKQGPGLAMLTTNDETLKQAQKQGYLMVMRKDPNKDYVRIKVRPDADLNLKELYEVIKEKDPQATWFYHPGGKMLLNGSSKHRNQVASSLNLKKIIELIKKIYD